MADDFQYIEGGAEPQEVEKLGSHFGSIKPSAEHYRRDALNAIDATFAQFTLDRVRGLSSNPPTFNDGQHPNVFVLSCNAIIGGLSGDHQKCALSLMGGDPISTFCILLDPGCDGDEFHREALGALRRLSYKSRSEANHEYLDNYKKAAAGHASASAVHDQLLHIKKEKFQATSNFGHDMCNFINKVYADVASNGKLKSVDVYPCLSKSLRERAKFYDETRYASACLFFDLYPSVDPHNVARHMKNGTAVDDQIKQLKHTLLSCLDMKKSLFECRAASTHGADNDVHMNKSCAHYFRTEFFIYTPLPLDILSKYSAATEKHSKEQISDQSSMIAGLSVNFLTPISFSVLYFNNFDKLF